MGHASGQGECAILQALQHGYYKANGVVMERACWIPEELVKHLEHIIDNLFWPAVAMKLKKKSSFSRVQKKKTT